MSKIQFDRETHTYTFNGKEIPSVTQIIHEVFPFWAPPGPVRDAALDLGNRVHAATEEYDLTGVIPWGGMKPYINAWAMFKEDSSVEWSKIEEPAYHPTLNYAGTPDRVGTTLERKIIADIKTGDHYSSHWLQLAGYALMFPETASVMCVHLTEQKYTVHTQDLTDPLMKKAKATFIACLQIHNWKKEKNLG